MKKNKIDNTVLNTKIKSWIKPLYTLIVVAIPSFFIWFFLGKDFQENPPFKILYNILIAFIFIFFITITTFVLIYFKVLEISIINFVFPIIICFMAIFLSSWLKEQWYRVLVVIPLIFIVIPTNMFVNYYQKKQIIKNKIKKEQKII